MHIEFYRSAFCPRCLMAARALRRLMLLFPDLTVETIEISIHPKRAWQAGIRMIPALKINAAILSGITLSERRIRAFIEDNVPPPSPAGDAQASPPAP